ncbi:hypothetical protein G7Y79_00014g037570 [Physcia stellaris]|nr:hypothetical protein G7Y79_00014g037570 [Physcia stellaris]
MSSNLFFPDNRGRYDRVQQLSNNIGTVKGLCAQSYTRISTQAGHIDEIRDKMMKKSGFKTIQELSDSIAATLPDSERDQYLNLMKALQDTDVFLGNASSVLTCVLGIAGGLRFFTGNARLVISVCGEGIFRAEFARGFKLFATGQLQEGTRVMRGVARWARQHYQFLGELTSKTARAVRVLRIFNTVLEFVAKWAAIHDFFCDRFSVQMQFDQFKQTEALYTAWYAMASSYDTVNSDDDDNIGLTPEQKAKILNKQGQTYMNDHEKNLASITDAVVWEECATYDRLTAGVYHGDDPNLAEVQRFLAEQAQKNPDEITAAGTK